jgi:probable rRNA maturation factor
VDADDDEPPEPAWLEAKLSAICDQLGLRDAELSVVVTDDHGMAALNEQFTGDRHTTDVLSFDLAEPPPPGGAADEAAAREGATPIEGELYLCLDEARRQAGERGHEVDRELLLYATHGLLHLLGYDDHEPDQHARMHQREDELLTAIGVGAVFADRSPAD